ncbi:MAG TPA: tyrosine-type recombinase/integrase [Candidatus Coprocola pullicola]|nr:tyrosine-type recombinase/integrase [Candidatus Coprocola pullicola]
MSTYHEEQKAKDTIRLRALLEELPYFLGEFFRGIANTTSVKTRINYANDLKIFFTYITKQHKKLKNIPFEDMDVTCLNDITAEDIDCFLEYITYYTKPDPVNKEKTLSFQNDEKGKARKLASIRSMYHFFFKKQKVSSNPAAIVDTPKIHDKQIIRLEANEVADLLDLVENCDTDAMSKRQKAHLSHTQKRDLALFTLLLGTGMRVSECVGINISDIDFHNNSVKILRKGGNETTLYFGEEVQQALLEYITQRAQQKNKSEKEEALFLSNRGTRITVRAVQNIVKKYARIVSPAKKISPHKLRSTYGTALYQETGDIYLVADVLGHADVNTTRKHYAEIEESRRRNAAKYIKLRKS